MGWFSDLFKSDFDKLIENGTDEELESDYERRRQEWLSRGQDGTGEKTPEMKKTVPTPSSLYELPAGDCPMTISAASDKDALSGSPPKRCLNNESTSSSK